MKSRVRQRCGSRRSPEHESSNAGYHRPERLRYSGSSVQVLIVCGRITLAEPDQIEIRSRSNICKDFTQMGVEILHSENHKFLVERAGGWRSSGRKDVRERDRLHLVAHSKSWVNCPAFRVLGAPLHGAYGFLICAAAPQGHGERDFYWLLSCGFVTFLFVSGVSTPGKIDSLPTLDTPISVT